MLVKCLNDRCAALYSRGDWRRGYDLNRGTTKSRDFRSTGKIPDDVCPMCGTPEGVEKSRPLTATM